MEELLKTCKECYEADRAPAKPEEGYYSVFDLAEKLEIPATEFLPSLQAPECSKKFEFKKFRIEHNGFIQPILHVRLKGEQKDGKAEAKK